jgi:hypothetical protein
MCVAPVNVYDSIGISYLSLVLRDCPEFIVALEMKY